jgi:hypothetical protein
MASPDPYVNRNGLMTKTIFTVATLPAAASTGVGRREMVSDLSVQASTNNGMTAAGGGTFSGQVMNNGTVWKITTGGV